ncbi:NRPS-like enzyme [Aspergillus leporis]|uniref:NRPS-like enzyme n=1 Tax=Aspergillus leporis TaxID=41062 RepID=A0A5N5WYI4_9EURO|nr:NRPS-like enzyme [Aspergillus leporis]
MEDLLFMDGQVSLKYSELIARADVLCQKLREKLFDSQEPICIFLESGLNQIIAQVAVLRAGGSCVPVEPSVPDMRLVDMLHDINSRYVITSKALTHRVSEFEVILVEDANEGDTPSAKNSTSSVLAGCSERHRSHILFTSGSAGKPKAVQILASSILHLVTTTPVTPLNPTDRMSSFVNPGFDLSLFEIWATLLSGATIVVIPQTIVTDPFSLGNFLQKWKVTVVIMPTALFNVICLHSPSTFHDLRHVLVVGEAANVNVMQKVLKSGAPQKLWNAYGPTETTTFSSLQLVSVDEAQRGRIGIGEPVGQTRWFLLDDQLNPITDKDQTGEICIAGPGLSQGYYNEPEANEERFICLEAQKLGEDATEHIRVYRTGDIGKWRIPLQSMDYIGRADNQIKRSGYRIELGDIERTLERNPYIKANATLYSKSEGDDSSDLLVAYVIPESWEDDFKPGDIINWAKERLLHYMVPDRVIRLREFPLTPRGKVDRNALNDNYHDTFREQKAEKAHIDPQERDPQTGDLSSWLKSTLQNSLDVSHFDIRDNFSLTGSPLCQLPVTMDALHANPTLESLVTFLHQASKASDGPIEISRLEQDSCIADDVQLLPDWQANTEGRVFITGVTGFVGAYLLHYLLSMPTVRKVACLVRSRGGGSATDRIQKTLEKYDLWGPSLEKMEKVMALDGDLSDDTLGLGEDRFTWLANWASIVFHIGAKVNWCEPYESHFESNIVGTRNAIRLAASGRRKPLHYLSSIDAWSVTGLVCNTKSVTEDGPLKPHLCSTRYDTGYAQSQWVAEEMVRRVRDRGLPVAIYRPGFVIGDSERAAGNPDDFFSRLIMGCIQIGYWPELPCQRLEYVTIDYVCSAILHIASKNHNLGRSYSLVSPDVTQSVDLEGTCVLLNKAGYSVKQIPYREWVAKVRELSDSPLLPLLPLLEEPILRDLTRMQALQALADRPDIRYTPLEHTLLRRKIDYWLRKGYYSLR